MTKPADDHALWEALGRFIRSQRRIADLSLRQLAERTGVSNPYLSQVERGYYRPSARVLKAIADALRISVEAMYAQAGLLDTMSSAETTVEQAITVDPHLGDDQKDALIGIYRSLRARGA